MEKEQPTDPITEKKEVAQNPDPKIDQDMPGFPHGQATKEQIQNPNPTPKANEKQEE